MNCVCASRLDVLWVRRVRMYCEKGTLLLREGKRTAGGEEGEEGGEEEKKRRGKRGTRGEGGEKEWHTTGAHITARNNGSGRAHTICSTQAGKRTQIVHLFGTSASRIQSLTNTIQQCKQCKHGAAFPYPHANTPASLARSSCAFPHSYPNPSNDLQRCIHGTDTANAATTFGLSDGSSNNSPGPHSSFDRIARLAASHAYVSVCVHAAASWMCVHAAYNVAWMAL
eukprot:44121-Chlamydomonas_euryale.AAC.3